MTRVSRTIAIGLAVLAMAGCARGPGGEQTLVDRSALTVQEMMTQTVSQDPKSLLRRAKGVMICPRVFKAALFYVGGEGGSCVLLARSGNGTWSYPTFYDIGSGSLGFQLGVQDSQLMFLIMTQRGLAAVMDSQVRLGATASVAVATVGMGVQGATTTAVGADIVAFAIARGLFGGVSLEGGVMSARTDSNQAYYGQPLAARQIVLQMQGVNPGADPLREVLTRYGNADPTGPGTGAPYTPYAPPQAAPGPQPYQGPAGQGPAGPTPYAPSYQPPGAPRGYQPVEPAPAPRAAAPAPVAPAAAPAPAPRSSRPALPLQASPRAPGYQLPQAPTGYQPPAGQYTYPPQSGSGPIQEQPLAPPAR